jgi:predicted  nucleic acid-binding Zn-ribbon protein
VSTDRMRALLRDAETMADDAADEIARLTTKVVRLTNELAEARAEVKRMDKLLAEAEAACSAHAAGGWS